MLCILYFYMFYDDFKVHSSMLSLDIELWTQDGTPIILSTNCMHRKRENM